MCNLWYLVPSYTLNSKWHQHASFGIWYHRIRWILNGTNMQALVFGTIVYVEFYMVPCAIFSNWYHRMRWILHGTKTQALVIGTNVHGECYMVLACSIWYLVPAYTLNDTWYQRVMFVTWYQCARWMLHGTSLHCEWCMSPERMVYMCMVQPSSTAS
jgi:hypothetical protein